MGLPWAMRRAGLGAILGLSALVWAGACGSDTADERHSLGDGCLINTDCKSPLMCAFRRCHTQCEDDRDCTEPKQLCVPSDRPFNVCLFADERDCKYNTDCPLGLVCASDFMCRPECKTAKDCVPGQSCVEGGCAKEEELLPDGGLRKPTDAGSDVSVGATCVYNENCPPGLVCKLGVCLPECIGDRDCPHEWTCNSGTCVPPAVSVDGGTEAAPPEAGPIPDCANGVKDTYETDIDCGGPCGACAGGGCTKPSDCASHICTALKCQAANCNDGLQNGLESDIDCGGTCAKCAAAKGCWNNADCQTGTCTGGLCIAPGCSNKIKDGAETDIDCGGSGCTPCPDGKVCVGNTDCTSGNCVDLKCVKAGPSTWVKTFATSAFYDAHLAQDSAGNIFLAVRFTGTINLGGGTISASGGTNTALAKYTPAGAHLWSRSTNTTGSDTMKSLRVDAQGNPVLAGQSVDGVSYGGPVLNCGATQIMTISKFNGQTGAHVLSRCIGGPGTMYPGTVAPDSNGDFIASGHFSGTVDFGGQSQTSSVATVFVAKYSGTNGALTTVKSFVPATSSGANDPLVVTQGTTTFLAGRFYGTLNVGTIQLKAANSSYWDVFVTALDATLTPSWAKVFGGGLEDHPVDIAIDGTQSVVIAGVHGSQIDVGGVIVPNQGASDCLVVRLKQSDGSTEWAKGVGSTAIDECTGVAVGSNGEVAVSGFMNASMNAGGGALPFVAYQDGFWVRFGSGGAHVFSKSWGTLSSEKGFAVGYSGTAMSLFGTYGANGLVDLGTGTLPNAGGAFFGLFLP